MSSLTPAEEMLLELLIDGYPEPAIAQLTGCSLTSTRSSIKVLLAKVGAADRAALRELRRRQEI